MSAESLKSAINFLTPPRAAALALIGAAATIAGAWWFEFVAGLEPCPLCLEQRLPYYLGMPLALLAIVLAHTAKPRAAGMALAAFALLMVYGAGLGVYHSGIEWELWKGPDACSGGGEIPRDAGSLLESLGQGRVPSCTEAAWRFLGLSLAGYNVLLSAALTVIAAIGAHAGLRSHARSSSGTHTA